MSIIKAFPSKNVFAEFGDCHLEYSRFSEWVSGIENFIGALIAIAEQVHGNNIHLVKKSDFMDNEKIKVFPSVDGLITKEKNIILAVKTADCLPILFFEPEKKIIGTIHAGREGVQLNIVRKMIQGMKKLGAKQSSILVEIGPAVCQKHYKVDRKVFDKFVSETNIPQKQFKLDLKKVVFSQLQQEDIHSDNITDHAICTFENENYFSYRRNKTSKRQMSFICLSEPFQT
ncbi:MAG: peptidoglycan editing factor PgeF [Candidatus Cloacimonetes bacterium]|nr:peptidoglycan editing factor PgeF [Candidatus Cloacimonadota bacterium]